MAHFDDAAKKQEWQNELKDLTNKRNKGGVSEPKASHRVPITYEQLIADAEFCRKVEPKRQAAPAVKKSMEAKNMEGPAK
jgi:hypothetical protein